MGISDLIVSLGDEVEDAYEGRWQQSPSYEIDTYLIIIRCRVLFPVLAIKAISGFGLRCPESEVLRDDSMQSRFDNPTVSLFAVFGPCRWNDWCR